MTHTTPQREKKKGTHMRGAFEFSATGVLGVRRESMLNNHLLLRSEVGKSSRSSFAIFPKDGPLTNVSSSSGTIGKIIHGSHSIENRIPKERRRSKHSSRPEPNILVPHPVVAEQKREKPLTVQLPLPPSMGYGLHDSFKMPASTMKGLLENQYQHEWLDEQRTKQRGQRKPKKKDTQSRSPNKVSPGKVSQGMRPENQAHAWKSQHLAGSLTTQARPHLDTFRSEGQRAAAFKRHQSTGKARERQGLFGHGIPVPPACRHSAKPTAK